MTKVAELRLSTCVILALGVCTLLQNPCAAVSMRVSAGFGGAMKTWTWTPVVVRLSNKSADSVEGTLHILSGSSGANGAVGTAARVTLPPNSKKRYFLYARLADGNPIKVELDGDYGVLATKKISVNPMGLDDVVVVSVGGRASRLAFLSGETISPVRQTQASRRYTDTSSPSGSSASDSNVVAGSIAPDELPARPAAYEGIDVLVMSEFASDSISPKICKAVSMWVASGGTLVVSAGTNYKDYESDFYNELLPVKVTGATSVSGLGSPGKMGGAVFPAGPVAVAESSIRKDVGKVLVSEGGVIILAERDYGAGKVFFLAADYTSPIFRSWTGQTKFWKTLAALPSTSLIVEPSSTLPSRTYGGYGYYRSQMGDLESVVVQNPSIKTPSFNVIGLFLLLYLAFLGPINYFVLKRRNRLQMAWVSTPAIVLVFALGAYGIGFMMKGGGLECREASFIEASSNARFASLITEGSMFSPSRRSYDIQADDPYSLIEVLRKGENKEPAEAQIASTSTIPGLQMAMWSTKTWESVSGTDLGGRLKSELVSSGGYIRGKIRNDTGYELKNCIVVCKAAVCRIGELKRGAQVAINLHAKPGKAVSPASSTYGGYGSGTDVKYALEDLSLTHARATGQPILLAAIPSTRIFAVKDEAASYGCATYCAFRLGYRSAGK